jgi:glycosyltransferase involved in cell wall biosynthesis
MQIRLEARCFHQADRVVVLTEAHAAHLRLRRPDVAAKVRVVPNMFDPPAIGPAAARAAGGALRVLYAGLIYGGRGLATVGRAIDAVSPDLPGFDRAVLEIAGKSCEGSWEEVLGGSHAGRRVHGVLSQAEVAALLRETHAGIVSNPSWDKVHIPGKLYEYLGAGLPVLNLTRQPDIPRLCEGIVPSWQLDPNDEEGIVRAIRELAQWWQAHPGGTCPPPSDHPQSSPRVAALMAGVFRELVP